MELSQFYLHSSKSCKAQGPELTSVLLVSAAPGRTVLAHCTLNPFLLICKPPQQVWSRYHFLLGSLHTKSTSPETLSYTFLILHSHCG